MAASVWRLEVDGGGTVASHIEVADGMWGRFVGLMGKRALPEGHGLCLRPCSQIHMFFMRFHIDAMFVDKDGRIVRLYADLKPWRVTRIVRKAKACIELPAGTAARAGVRVGDLVRLVGD